MTTVPIYDVLFRRSISAAGALTAAVVMLGPSLPICQALPNAAKPISYVRTDNGKSFVVANGQPYLMYGVQIRIDHVIGETYSTNQAAMVAEYFAHSKSMGFHTVVVPVRWSYIEQYEGTYNFSYLNMIIDQAKANDLDVQLLWYGSDVCGWNLVPSYIANDRVRFPRNATYDTFFDLSNPELIKHEKTVVAAMMAHIAKYDTSNRVIMVQVENEPDGAGSITKDLKWGNDADMTAKMFAGNQFPAVVALMDTLGKVIHESPRNVVTRCNVGTNYRALDLYKAKPKINPGVDIYGVDSYSLDPAVIKQMVSVIPGNAGNVSHQPEGGGKAGNLVNLTLADFEEGAGSLIYELRGLEGDNGIYRHPATPNDWTERDGSELLWNKQPENKTSQIRDFNSMIYKVDKELAVVPKGKCAAFNVDNHAGNWTETKTVAGVPLTYQTWDGAPAFALQDSNGALILMSMTAGNVFTVDPGYVRGADVSVGYFDATNKWHEQYRKPFQGRTLLMWKGDVVRIPAVTR